MATADAIAPFDRVECGLAHCQSEAWKQATDTYRQSIGYRDCVRCGCSFLPWNAIQQFCSKDCRKRRTPPACKDCGRPVTVPSRGTMPTYCKDCGNPCNRKRQPFFQSCQACGGTFLGRKRKYCVSCGISRCAPRQCQACKTTFVSTHWATRYCPPCRHKARLLAKTIIAVGTCRHCGEEFWRVVVWNRRQPPARLCSQYCRDAHYTRNRQHCRAAGGNGETIEMADLYARDGGLCGICREPVDRALEWPDPMSASVDHVLPFNRGGLHTWDNVQLAHLACNVRKGAS